jgi:hypothetical protein
MSQNGTRYKNELIAATYKVTYNWITPSVFLQVLSDGF